jgi:protein phosphatase
MRIEAGVATDIGQVREGNEDSYLVEPPLYAVADGMGGHRGGEVASQLALETVEAMFREGRGSLAEQVRQANRVVFERSVTDPKVAGMGTTLTAALVTGDSAHLVHVGDSRAYLLRAGTLRQITEDHTMVARMVRLGEISEAEAEIHPHKNVLTRALGTDPDVDVDEQDLGLLDGDRLLLCSDGLTTMVTPEQIQAILEATASAQDAADRLVRAANRAGGIDNITVVVMDVKGTDGSGGEPTAAPQRPRGTGFARRDLARWGIGGAVALLVAVVALVALRTWLDGRWYVGVANGHVAVYQGIPAELLVFDLSHVDVETDISAEAAMDLPVYEALPDGINATSREDALSIVEQIRDDLRKQERIDRGTAP